MSVFLAVSSVVGTNIFGVFLAVPRVVGKNMLGVFLAVPRVVGENIYATLRLFRTPIFFGFFRPKKKFGRVFGQDLEEIGFFGRHQQIAEGFLL